MDTERQTLSIMKACEVVGVSRRTIYNWMAGGKSSTCGRPAGRSASSPTPCGKTRKPKTARFSTDARDRRRAALENRGVKMDRRSYSVATICSNGALWNSRGNFASSFTS